MSSLIEKSYKVAEMEKRADGADTSVLFFLLCGANFLAVPIAQSFLAQYL